MIIDFHAHLFPDSLAFRTIPHLQRICGLPPTSDGTRDTLLARMEQWGVDLAVVQHIATKPHQQQTINDFAASLQGEKLRCFGTVHPDSPEPEKEVERIHRLGLKGVKLHPDYQGFFADDPKADPIYEACRALGLPVLFHAGWDYISPEVSHGSPKAIAAVLDRFPGLTIIAAHLGGMARCKEAKEYLIGRPVYIDTSMAWNFASPEEAKRILLHHDPQRILYGSDCPWGSLEKDRPYLDALGLPEDLMEKIWFKNALALLGE